MISRIFFGSTTTGTGSFLAPYTIPGIRPSWRSRLDAFFPRSSRGFTSIMSSFIEPFPVPERCVPRAGAQWTGHLPDPGDAVDCSAVARYTKSELTDEVGAILLIASPSNPATD